MLPAIEDRSTCDPDNFAAISLRPRLSCILKLKLNQMDDQSTFLNSNLNVKAEDLTFVIMVKNIMKILSKYCDKATREKNHKGNDHIDDLVNMNKEVHDMYTLVNEVVDLCNLPLLYEDIMLKWNYPTLDRMLSREYLTFDKEVQLMEEVIVKENESLERSLMCVDVLSNNMVEHVVHQMQSDLELSLEEYVSSFPISQVKNYSCSFQGTYAERSCTRIFLETK